MDNSEKQNRLDKKKELAKKIYKNTNPSTIVVFSANSSYTRLVALLKEHQVYNCNHPR
jgi:hypothetical protein